ncbi:MAG: hypothetical protein ABIS01_07670, partial [Ferruginibacter sp.]
MLASGIVSLRLVGNKKIQQYMNKFYWYSVVVATLSFYTILNAYFHFLGLKALGVLQSSLLLFHFAFLSLFIYRVLPNKKFGGYMKLIFILFLILIAFCMFETDLSKRHSKGYTFS